MPRKDDGIGPNPEQLGAAAVLLFLFTLAVAGATVAGSPTVEQLAAADPLVRTLRMSVGKWAPTVLVTACCLVWIWKTRPKGPSILEAVRPASLGCAAAVVTALLLRLAVVLTCQPSCLLRKAPPRCVLDLDLPKTT